MSILFLFTATVSLSISAQESNAKESTTLKIGGYAKTDFMYTQYGNGASTGGRDYHIPSLIPVGVDDAYSYTDFHVKESRINLEVAKMINEKKLRAFVEMDFNGSLAGNEVVSNSYNPRLRHFFLEYDKLLVGQTWSTFMIVIVPEELDFLGAPEGLVFIRQPQIRLTLGNFQVAVENPYVTYYTYQSDESLKSDASLIPEIVLRYNLNFDAGNLSAAVIGRQLSYSADVSNDKGAVGFGMTVGGKIKAGSKDDIRFVGTAGSGLGRYQAVNFVNSSVIDEAGKLKPIMAFNGYLAYLHYWTDKLCSSFSFSYFQASFDEDITASSINKEAWSVSGNLLYSPVPKLMFGVEPIYAIRKTIDGTDGDMFRLQASAKWAFSFKTSVE